MATGNNHRLVTLDDLKAFKADITLLIRQLPGGNAPQKQKKWLKSAEVPKCLGISPGKLQGIRESGLLPYTRIGGNIYYDEDDLSNLLNENKKCKR